MSEEDKKQPKKISKQEADSKQDYAQGLNDEITDVVDYGDLGEEQSKKK
tara:strand:- start:684 stop:830 length:147 start_codon:yes stop_codon:yes gene_type:complete